MFITKVILIISFQKVKDHMLIIILSGCSCGSNKDKGGSKTIYTMAFNHIQSI